MAAVTCLLTAVSTDAGPGGIAGGLTIAAALTFRTHLPSAALALTGVSCAVQLGAHDAAVWAWLGYAPLIYFYASHPRHVVRWGFAAAALLAAFMAGWSLTESVAPDTALGSSSQGEILAVCALFFVAPVAVVWAFGYVGYQRRAGLASEFEARSADEDRRRALERLGVEEERNKIARDIHDVVAHSLTVVVAQAEGARYQFDSSPDAARHALQVIAETGRASLTDVRTFLEQLRHRNIPTSDRSYRDSRDVLLAQFSAAGLSLDTCFVGTSRDASGLLSVTLYRVLAEALTNALKHGDVSHPVRIEETWRTDGVCLKVRNRISRAAMADPMPEGKARDRDWTAMGLVNLAERVALVRGSVETGPVDDDWVVDVHLPAPDSHFDGARATHREEMP